MLQRRTILSTALLGAVAACTGAPRGYSLEEGVRRLLTLSTQRAFARLFAPDGFYDSQVAKLPPSPALGGKAGSLGAILSSVLETPAVRRRLSQALNRIAQDAAARATPIVMDAIRGLPPGEALATIRGGPTAATDLLRRRAGPAVADAILPFIGRGLRSDLMEVAGAALSGATGVDYVELGQTLAAQAMDAMFDAIAREEAAIRADPAATRDPVLVALLGRR